MKYNKEIDSASKILVVGGGPTGTEWLGEIIEKYRDSKQYGIMNSKDGLLSGFPARASRSALNYFQGKKSLKEW